MTSHITVSLLQPCDIPGAITCIQRAFANDPYRKWIFDAEKFSHSRNRVSLGIRCEWGIKNALFYVAKDTVAVTQEERDKVLGVACWLSPRDRNLPQSWYEWWQEWLLWGRQITMNLWWGRGGLNVKRYYIWKQAQAEAQSELWTDACGYYFCNIVTVLPEVQGKGVGKLLFKAVTDKADVSGRRCYLESSRDQPNTAIYERMGFTKVKEMKCDDDGDVCKLYCMMREPRLAAAL